MIAINDIRPENTLYYNGAIILMELQKEPIQKIEVLYYRVKMVSQMTFSIFVLSLDWLYLINAAQINKEGEIEKCI